MSDQEKQEIIDRLFQGHEVRLRVVKAAVERIDGKLDKMDERIASLQKTMHTVAGGFYILVPVVLAIAGYLFLK